MSERLRAAFQRAKAEGRVVFGPYVTGGYPTRDDTVPILLAMEAGGADLIEFGVPFSDPLADGATVEHANHVAVADGVTFADCLDMVRDARARGLTIPLVLMGYLNPLLAYGLERAAADARDAGADGFIVVDLPPEEAGDVLAACRAAGIALVPLVAPTTAEDRLDRLVAVADAFIYCVSVTGTTGARDALPEHLAEFLARVRRHTTLPLAVGFGIKTREHVLQVGELAEAAVIGSAIITTLDAAPPSQRAERVRAFVEDVTGHVRTGDHGPASG